MVERSALVPAFGPRGRWGGALTKRPLPATDPLLEALPTADRDRLADIWLYRAAMERRVADSFTVIRDALTRRQAAASLIELAERAIDDEHRHAELSRLVASRFAGTELDAPTRLSLELPSHGPASPALRDTLFIVGQCVLNETTAGAFLETCLEHARGSLAKSAIQELLSDEIDHGRIGWAYLASLSPDKRAEVGPWLLPMAYLNLRLWTGETPDDPTQSAGLTAHGSPPAAVMHRALLDALKSLIVPGLRQLGMLTRPLEAWLAAGAFVHRPPREFLDA